jgi:non-structural maintenance of chromosomes element 4
VSDEAAYQIGPGKLRVTFSTSPDSVKLPDLPRAVTNAKLHPGDTFKFQIQDCWNLCSRMAGPPDSVEDEDARRQLLQTEKQRAKKVIKELREHIETLDENKDEVLNPRSSALASHFLRAEENVRKAKTVDQALIDAQIFAKLSDFSRRQAAQLQSGLKQYDARSFVDRLAQIMQQSRNGDDDDDDDDELDTQNKHPELDLHTLGRNIWNRYRTFPSMHFMYGNSEVQPRVVKAKKSGKRVKKGAAAVKPKEMTEEAGAEVGEADQQIKEMKELLQKHGEHNFWTFVVDPASFTRSIENIFHSSFLVKEGHAKLNLSAEPPMITFNLVRKDGESGSSAEAQAREFEENSQYIMRFDFNLWRTVVEKYNISSCMLPSSEAPKWDELAHLADDCNDDD